MPALCWSTSIWPLVQFGLKLKFVDIDLNTLNVNFDDLKKRLQKNKRFVINKCTWNKLDLFKISKFAQKRI